MYSSLYLWMYYLARVILTETRKCTYIHVCRIKIILLNMFTVCHDNILYMKTCSGKYWLWFDSTFTSSKLHICDNYIILCKISCFQIISYFWKICVRNAASLWHQIQTFVFQVAWQQVDAFYVQRGQVGHHTLHCPVQYNIQIIIIKSITRFLH